MNIPTVSLILCALLLILSSCAGSNIVKDCYESAYQYMLRDTVYHIDKDASCHYVYEVSDSLNSNVGRLFLVKKRAKFLAQENNLDISQERQLEISLYKRDNEYIRNNKNTAVVYQNYIPTIAKSCCKVVFSPMDKDTLFAAISNFCWKENEGSINMIGDTTNFTGVVLPSSRQFPRYEIVYMFIFRQGSIYYVSHEIVMH